MIFRMVLLLFLRNFISIWTAIQLKITWVLSIHTMNFIALDAISLHLGPKSQNLLTWTLIQLRHLEAKLLWKKILLKMIFKIFQKRDSLKEISSWKRDHFNQVRYRSDTDIPSRQIDTRLRTNAWIQLKLNFGPKWFWQNLKSDPAKTSQTEFSWALNFITAVFVCFRNLFTFANGFGAVPELGAILLGECPTSTR